MKNFAYAMVSVFCVLGSVLFLILIFKFGGDIVPASVKPWFGGSYSTKVSGSLPVAQIEGHLPVDETWPEPEEVEPVCTTLDLGRRTLIVSAYEGVVKGNFYMSDPDNESYIVPVYVDKLKEPVNLILGSYSAHLWDFKFKDPADKALIKQVVVGGVYASAVRNLTSATEVVFSDHSTSARELKCLATPMHESDVSKVDMASFAREAYGLTGKIEGYSQYQVGSVLISEDSLNGVVAATMDKDATDAKGDPLKIAKLDVTAFVGGTDTHSSHPIVVDPVPSGMAGIEYLVKQGVLRKATSADVTAFAPAKAREEKRIGQRIDDTYDFMTDYGYVLIKPKLVMPRGMFGSNGGISILVPLGDHVIEGQSHNTLCYMSNGTCTINQSDE